jgi:hypothetical protein
MKAWKIVAGISCCSILATGCSMCQHPSFDCGPVWSQGTCLISNPDYRAGSILNRSGPGVAGTEGAGAKGPAPRVAEPGRVAGPRSDGSESESRARTVAQPQTAERASAEGRTIQAPPQSTVALEAPLPDHLPLRADAAPAETTEGDARILPEKPSEDLNGWRPVATRQAPDLGTP